MRYSLCFHNKCAKKFFLIFALLSPQIYAATATAGFTGGAIAEYINNAHQPNDATLLSFSTLNITEAIISDETDDGTFGGTQGNDYDVTLTLRYSNGTVKSFNASVNWRDTQGKTLYGIGLTTLGSADDGSSYSLTNNTYSKTYILEASNSAYADGGGLLGGGNAATTGLLDALNSYANNVAASDTPSVLSSTITAADSTISADGISTTTITVQLQDVNGNNINSGGETIVISSTKGTMSGTTDNEDGTYTATLTSSNIVETASVTATLNGSAINDSDSVDFTAVDDTAPVITGPSGAAGDATSAISVNEEQTTVTTFTANEAVTWSITGGDDQGQFTIDANTGAITFDPAPDFENPVDANTDNNYLVTVTATDADNNTSTQTLTVTVLDLDDTAPVITGPSGAAGDATSAISVNEEQTTVTTFTANEAVTWSITGGDDQGQFTIDANTGAITFDPAPDFENPVDANTDNNYLVTVTATDADNNTSTQTLTVTVLDLDDTAPVITGPSGAAGDATSAISVNEEQTTVTTFTANEAVTWSITGGDDQGQFTIDANTGAITFDPAPDFENPVDANTDNNYLVTVTATDADNNTSTQTLTVTVLDLDDTAPVITGPSGAAGDATSAISVNEEQTTVTTFTANEAVTWSITGGDDQGQFTIDANTGAITFDPAPDFENPVDANTDNNYLVTVTATDADNNTSTQTLTVTVLDLDDTAPVITGPSGAAGDATSAISVNEEQTTVTTFTANEAVTWSITGGDDQGQFTIDANTGAITFDPAPDFENPVDANTDNNYLVTVTATDADNNTSTQTLTVTVLDLDDTAPVITGPSGAAGDATSAISVNEEQTTVTTFTANEAVTWSITGGDDQGQFTIDANTGAITFDPAPDFENPVDANTDNNYLVTVTATDADNNTSTQTLTVTVLDLDDTAPVITGPSGAAGDATSAISVNEEQTTVTTFTANEAVTWSITGGDDQGQFTIDANTGAITFDPAPDFENPVDANTDNNYLVTVTATDADNNTSTQTLTVTVLDLDDTAPVITGPSGAAGDATSAISVNEEQTTVTTFTANEAVTWSITGGDDQGQFTIDANTGAITFDPAPDFENPVDANTDNNYLVTVTATDADNNTSTQTLTVTVLDLDDTAPVITGPSGAAGDATSAISVNEEQTTVTTFTANEAVTWSITGGDDQGQFTIDANTGAITFDPAPDFENPVDANTDNNYLVTVTATDADNNTSTQTLTVTVLDLDDTAPVITGPSGAAGDATSAISVNEEQTTVTTFTANEAVTWSITGGDDQGQFTIDANTGAITFDPAPDFENPVDANTDNNYLVTVTATDADNNTSTQTLTVTVLDLDDTAPVITGPSGAAGDATSAISVNEEQTTVTTFTANEAVTWSITGGDDQGQFTIDANTGAITFDPAPDFENPVDANTDNNYLVTVTATDADNNTSTQTLTVTVLDLDDTAPVITGPSGAAGDATSAISVNEEQTTVTTFTANEAVTWSITGGDDQGQFTIDANTGAITFDPAPDFENPVDANTDNDYLVTVTATDADNNTSTQTLTVTVLDLDDTAPVITGPSGAAGDATSAISVNEEQTTVTTFTANEAVTWSITGGDDQGQFTIDANTGAITFDPAPDFENPVDTGEDNVYVVEVTAVDKAGNTSTQTLTVTVLDLDDTAPVITGINIDQNIITVLENNSSIISLSANEEVAWTIPGGSDAALLSISTKGELRFINSPDYENPVDINTDNDYELIIRATDLAGNFAKLNLIVRVINKDEVRAKLREIKDDLQSGLQNYVLRSLSDSLSFNESQVRKKRDLCVINDDKLNWDISPAGKSLNASLNYQNQLTNCEEDTRVYLEAGVVSSENIQNIDDVIDRGFLSLITEKDFNNNITAGLGLRLSFADGKIARFEDSSIEDHTAEIHTYLTRDIDDSLRVGVFGSLGKSWYEFNLNDDGFLLDGKMDGKRKVFGTIVSGDFLIKQQSFTTDLIYSRSTEDINYASLNARYLGESLNDILFYIGELEADRLSIPVSTDLIISRQENTEKALSEASIAFGLLCEDNQLFTNDLECGYQANVSYRALFGKKLSKNLSINYAYEKINEFKRDKISLGIDSVFGNKSQLTFSSNLGLIGQNVESSLYIELGFNFYLF